MNLRYRAHLTLVNSAEKQKGVLIKNKSFFYRSCVSAGNVADFSSGKFSRAEDPGSNFDSMARSREPAEVLGLLENKTEPGHGEYELVDIRQQQMLGKN